MNSMKVCLSRNLKSFTAKNSRFFSSSPQVDEKERAKKTSLFDFHVARGGKIVNFAEYLLPVQYADQGLVQSHSHTRAADCASIFDVSGRTFLFLFVLSPYDDLDRDAF
jgi:Aminomethyltransferase folate-binding domain